MDLDKDFVSAVLKDGEKAFLTATQRGVTSELLFGDGKKAWDFVVKFRREYGNLPSPDVVFEKVKVDLSMLTSDGHKFFIDEVVNRKLFQTLRDGVGEIVTKLDSADPLGAREKWTEIHRKVLLESMTATKVESLLSLGQEVVDYYDNVKTGKRGIPTPWPTMNSQTMGWWPEDFALFVGRLGTGKTWTLLLIAHAAWKAGYRTMLAATEMNKVKMALRFFALHFRLPYDDLRKGKLGEFVEQKFRDGVFSLMKEQGIYIVGGDFDFSIDNVDAAIEECEPQLAAIDGAYLIKNTGKDRHERVSNTFDDLKRIAKRRRLVAITNTQFNRAAKKGQADTIAAENIGITDVAGWNADAIYGLQQTDEMRENSQMGWKALKIREGKPDDFLSRWDLDTMDFSEIVDGQTAPEDNGRMNFGDMPARTPGEDDESGEGLPDLGDDLPF